MHHQVAQSRDRIYVVFWRTGIRPDLELELHAHCERCDGFRTVRQGWKNGRTVGRYRQQWIWACTRCGAACEPGTRPAAEIIDWTLPSPRIGDRRRPLAAATRTRILAGLQRHGWVPVITAGGGNGFERTPGNRARAAYTEPLPAQTCTASHALATAPYGFLFQTAQLGRTYELTDPHATVCASDDRLSLVLPLRRHGHAQPTSDPVPTVTAGGNHHALIMRNNNGGGGAMITPVTEPVRTNTTAGHQSLLVPYYGTGQAQRVTRPVPSVTTKDRFALVDPPQLVDDCGFRMLEPHEIAAAMAFPGGYIPSTLTKKARVKLAGTCFVNPCVRLKGMSGYWECPQHGHRRAYLFEGKRSCPTCAEPMVHDWGRAPDSFEDWVPPTPEERAQYNAERQRRAAKTRRAQRVAERRAGLAATFARRGMDADKAADRVDETFTLKGEWVNTCSECRKEFRSKRSDAATCSPRCRQRRARRLSL